MNQLDLKHPEQVILQIKVPKGATGKDMDNLLSLAVYDGSTPVFETNVCNCGKQLATVKPGQTVDLILNKAAIKGIASFFVGKNRVVLFTGFAAGNKEPNLEVTLLKRR